MTRDLVRTVLLALLAAACRAGDYEAQTDLSGSQLPIMLGRTTLEEVLRDRGDPVQEAALHGRIHYYYGEHTFFFGSDSIAVGARIADDRSRGEIEQLFGAPQEQIRRANHALWVQYRDSIGVIYDSAGQHSRFIEYMLRGHQIRPMRADSSD